MIEDEDNFATCNEITCAGGFETTSLALDVFRCLITHRDDQQSPYRVAEAARDIALILSGNRSEDDSACIRAARIMRDNGLWPSKIRKRNVDPGMPGKDPVSALIESEKQLNAAKAKASQAGAKTWAEYDAAFDAAMAEYELFTQRR